MVSGLLRAAYVPEDPPPWVFEEVAGEMVNPALAGWSAAIKKLFQRATGPDCIASRQASLCEVIMDRYRLLPCMFTLTQFAAWARILSGVGTA
jgi:hypothetical protein